MITVAIKNTIQEVNMPWSRKTEKVLVANIHTATVSHLSVDWYVAVA